MAIALLLGMIRTCTSCGRPNRVPPRYLGRTGRCGACKVKFAPLGEAVEVSSSELDEIVRDAKLPVLVDFWAQWCGPCRMSAPEVDAVADAMAGRAIVLKVDTEKHPDLAARFGVRGIPHFIVFRDGRPVLATSGARRRDEMQRWLG